MAEYVERHAIAATLTAAVNDTISKLPDNPYGAMVRCRGVRGGKRCGRNLSAAASV